MSGHDCCVTYADKAWQGTVEVLENIQVAQDTFRVRFACPEIARQVVPGQFVMLRLAGLNDPLLGRPLAVFNVSDGPDGQPLCVDVVYLVVGKMTRRLPALQPGMTLEVWGPLGNGFPPTDAAHLIMVAGGIGQTPFLTLAQECLRLRTFGEPARQVEQVEKVTLCYGGRSGDHLAGVEDFRRLGVDVRLSTDDGSMGHHGLVTDLIRPVLEQSAAEAPSGKWQIVCCGPERMMAATARIAQELDLPCHVSLETPMACGIGICFSCVAKIRDASGEWDYRRTCVEGPVFDARTVEF